MLLARPLPLLTVVLPLLTVVNPFYRGVQESSSYLEALLPSCSDYVFAIGPDGQLQETNKPLHRLFPA